MNAHAYAAPGPWDWRGLWAQRAGRGEECGPLGRLAGRLHAEQADEGPGDREHGHELGHRGGHRHGGGRGSGPGPFGPGGPGSGGRPGFGGSGFGGPGSGPGGGPFGRGGGRGRGPRVRRGDVRTAVLALLADQPMHGYQMISELAERSGGAWRPSPGSIYPVLQLLTDEGLVRAEETEGRRVFSLTDTGREQVEALGDRPRPWEQAASGAADELTELASLLGQVGVAVEQVAAAGTPEQVDAARALLASTRRSLYRILAGDEPAAGAEGSGAPQPGDGATAS